MKKSGTVALTDKLEDKLFDSYALLFLEIDEKVVGIKALKRPLLSYRRKVFNLAGVPDQTRLTRIELGWTYIEEKFRNCGYNSQMTKALQASRYWKRSFATTLTSNVKVKTSLRNVGFKQVGKTWPSTLVGGDELCLFISDH